LAQSLGLLPLPGGLTADGPSTDGPPADTDAAHPAAYPPAPTAAPDERARPEGLWRSTLADLLGIRTPTGTAVAHRPHIAAVDELTGQLLALTDAAVLRAGQALGPPPAPTPTPPPPLSRGSSGCATAAAVSRDAASDRSAATWTTPCPGRPGRPRTTTSAACADTTTG
jgi:hypothetical protein